MKELQELNKEPDTVSWEMMLFLVINTSSIQLIPFTVIGVLTDYGSKNPTAVVLPVILSTVISTTIAIVTLYTFRKFYTK
jgi:spore maturation protein A